MFRKYYRSANDDIKPSEEFVNSVIQNAKAHKPPKRRQYVKYAATAAAAAAVVSAAVISMPVWNRVDDAKDGIIIEETSLQTEKPSSDSGSAAAPPLAPNSPRQESGAADNHEERAVSEKPSEKTVNESDVPSANSPSISNQPAADIPEEPEIIEQKADLQGEVNNALKSKVMDNSETDEESYMVQNAAVFAAPKADLSEEKSEQSEPITDAEIPTPAGYYCTRASWNGYTFVNDGGAVITVTISYGASEESAPYYEQDGDNIYATYAAYGMTVTVNASGADIDTVKEIINSLR